VKRGGLHALPLLQDNPCCVDWRRARTAKISINVALERHCTPAPHTEPVVCPIVVIANKVTLPASSAEQGRGQPHLTRGKVMNFGEFIFIRAWAGSHPTLGCCCLRKRSPSSAWPSPIDYYPNQAVCDASWLPQVKFSSDSGSEVNPRPVVSSYCSWVPICRTYSIHLCVLFRSALVQTPVVRGIQRPLRLRTQSPLGD
jgi:hypothetical protein